MQFHCIESPIIIIYFLSPKITDTRSDISHAPILQPSHEMGSPPLLAFSQTTSAPLRPSIVRPSPSALGTKSMTKWIPKRHRATAQHSQRTSPIIRRGGTAHQITNATPIWVRSYNVQLYNLDRAFLRVGEMMNDDGATSLSLLSSLPSS